MEQGAYSAGRHQDFGNTLYSFGKSFSILFMLRANMSFRQISLMLGKWLIFCKHKQYSLQNTLMNIPVQQQNYNTSKTMQLLYLCAIYVHLNCYSNNCYELMLYG